MRVSREIGFHAVHSHHGMITESKHGHDYKVVLTFEGEPNEEGFVCDFRAIKRMFKRLVAEPLDGGDLDGLFEFPTAESLAIWIWNRLQIYFPLFYVEVKEKPHSSAVYFGPKGERS